MESKAIKPGMAVVHRKMQCIGKVLEVSGSQAQVHLSDRIPIQTWNLDEIYPWEPEKEMEKLENRFV